MRDNLKPCLFLWWLLFWGNQQDTKQEEFYIYHIFHPLLRVVPKTREIIMNNVPLLRENDALWFSDLATLLFMPLLLLLLFGDDLMYGIIIFIKCDTNEIMNVHIVCRYMIIFS